MKNVLIAWSNPDEEIFRQTPNRSGRWNNTQFHSDPHEGPFDAIIVLDTAHTPFTAEAKQAIFIPGEPPDLRHYPKKYLKQFDLVLSQQERQWPIKHLSIPCGMNWHLGWDRSDNGKGFWYDYDRALHDQPIKSKDCSCISSTKAVIAGHVKRLRFSHLAKGRLADRLDLFGRGLNSVDDKYSALSPYRYHIAIENSRIPGYWSEKLTDSLLAWAVPFYHGDPNILNKFPNGSIIPINLSKPQEALNIIEDTLSKPNDYIKRIEPIRQSRQLILNNYNLFGVIDSALGNLTGKNVASSKYTIKTPSDYNSLSTNISRAKLKISRRIKRTLTSVLYKG